LHGRTTKGALNTGCMPLFVALISAIAPGEAPAARRKLGLALILTGAGLIVGWHTWGVMWSQSRAFGDALFLFASFLPACFTVQMREAKLEASHAVALVSTGSLVIYRPVYLAFHGTHFSQLTPTEFAIQAVFQGVVMTIPSLLLYYRAVAVLGASAGARLEPWSRPFRHCLRSHSWENGRQTQIGAQSC